MRETERERERVLGMEFIFNNLTIQEAGDMSQRLRALDALKEDPGSVSSTLLAAHTVCDSGSRGSKPSYRNIFRQNSNEH